MNIHNAAFNGNIRHVRNLLNSGTNVNLRNNEEGQTPLISAARRGHLDIVRLLISRGANVNARDTASRVSPLMAAAAAGHVQVIRELIKKGAYVNARSEFGETPIMFAAMNSHPRAVRELLDAGANPNPNIANIHGFNINQHSTTNNIGNMLRTYRPAMKWLKRLRQKQTRSAYTSLVRRGLPKSISRNITAHAFKHTKVRSTS